MSDTPPDTLLTFPCDFTFKIFGKSGAEFESAVMAILDKHLSQDIERKVTAKPSENGKYTALNVSVHVDSKEQLDNIYRELTACPHVLMTL